MRHCARAAVRRLAPITAVAVAAIALGSPSAFAGYLYEHEFTGEFTGEGTHQLNNPRGIAVDHGDHTVYVTDTGNRRVVKFDADGDFILMFGDGVNETTGGDVCTAASGDTCKAGAAGSDPGAFQTPVAIVVDNSGGISDGAVYVADTNAHRVSKFAPTGNIISGWGVNGQLTTIPGRPFSSIRTIGVEPGDGSLWVRDSDWYYRFDPEGIFKRQFSLSYNTQNATLGINSKGIIYFQQGLGAAFRLSLETEQVLEEFGTPLTSPGAGFSINPFNDDVYVSKGNQVEVYSADCVPNQFCAPLETFGSGFITGGEGVALDPGPGVVYVATNTGVAMFVAPLVPDVSVGQVADYTPSTLDVTATADPSGGGDIIGCEVEYGPTDSYGSSVPCDQSMPMTVGGEVSATIPGLTPETTYHFRFVVENANGTNDGPDSTGIPHHVLALSTQPASEIGPGNATLNGTLDPAGDGTHYYFEWGTDTTYGNLTPVPPGTDAGSVAGVQQVSVLLDDVLSALTTYHYRIVATNSNGTSHGEDVSFTTTFPLMPVVTGEPATSVQATRAVLNATVNPGFGDTRFFFQYGKSTDYETVTAPGASVGEDHAVHGVATQIEGLDPGTTYHYRVIAFNFSGTTKGPNQVFVTPDVPGVTSTSASSVTSSSAQLNALVVPNSRATTVHFEFGTPTYGQVGLYSVSTPETASIGADTAPHPVSAAAAGLQPATTYNFRVVATNSEGITYGPNQTFTTGPAAVPIEPLTCKRGQVKRKGRCVNRKCKRGQVKRKGKCVKRKRAVRRASKRRSRDRG